MSSFILAAFASGGRVGGRLVDYPFLCSVFAATGISAEDVLYAVEHCRASWKWCGISGNLAPLPDNFQSGFIALVRCGEESWILAVLAYSLHVVLYPF